MQEKELFEDYELNKRTVSPSFFKIIGATVVLHALAIGAFSQIDLFSQKACDSPLLGTVCQAMDAAYVGGIFWGTERTSVDEPYDPSQIADIDPDEVVWVPVADAPFKYPEGYFAPDETELAAIDLNNPAGAGIIPGITDGGAFNPGGTITPGMPNPVPPVGGSILDKPQNLPKKNDTPIIGGLPDSSSVVGENPIGTPSGRRNGPKPKVVFPGNSGPNPKPTNPPSQKPGKDETASEDPKTSKTTPAGEVASEGGVKDEIKINKAPIKDLGRMLLTRQQQLDLNAGFQLGAKGKLDANGRLTEANFFSAEGDPQMLEVAKQAIKAIDESGYLKYLEKLSGKDLELMLKQDEAGFSGAVRSELESEAQARRISSALAFAIGIAKKGKTAPDDKDDLTLLNSIKATTDGKSVVLNFLVPKAIAMEMINRKLTDLAREPADPKKPNGAAVSNSAAGNAGK